MKHLLNGIAIAAVFAIAAPALAQNAPMTPAAPPAKTAPAAAPTAAPTKGATAMPRKPMRHRMARRGMMNQGGGGGDRMTEDLNRQELARLQGGGMAPQGGMAPHRAAWPRKAVACRVAACRVVACKVAGWPHRAAAWLRLPLRLRGGKLARHFVGEARQGGFGPLVYFGAQIFVANPRFRIGECSFG